MSNRFIDLKNVLDASQNTGERRPASVLIKSEDVQPTERKRIIKEHPVHEGARLESMIRDGEIEGVRVMCKCGEVIQIFFEYD